MIKNADKSLIRDLQLLSQFIRKGGIEKSFFVQAALLSAAVTIVNMYTISLLPALVQGVIKQDFSTIKSVPVLKILVRNFHPASWDQTRLFLLLVLWIYVTILLKNIIRYVGLLSSAYQVRLARERLRNGVLLRYLQLGKAFFDNQQMSFLTNLLLRSTNVVTEQFKTLQEALVQLLLLSVYLVMMVRISLTLTAISLVAFPLVTISTRQIIKTLRKKAKLSYQITTTLDHKVHNILSNLTLILGFNKTVEEFGRFASMSRLESENWFKHQRLLNLIPPVEDLGTTTATLFVALGMMWLFRIHTPLDPSQSFVFVYLASLVVPGLNAINRFKGQVLDASSGLEDLNSLFDDSGKKFVSHGQKEFTQLKGNITIENLSFGYEADKCVLNKVNLVIEKGKITALVGPTGSGKSTITNLLLRLYDCDPNAIFLDGIDIREFTLGSLRDKISFVAQDAILVNETVKFNICYGEGAITDEARIMLAADMACAHAFIKDLPSSYNTEVGERGAKLSGGERQRLSIARAMMKDAEIYVFDEPTSALDAKTENLIMERIRIRTAGKTVLIIAHRFSTIKAADKIAYLEAGSVLESGSLDELIKLKGHFYSQWISQMGNT